MNKKYFMFIALVVLIVSISSVSANDLNETDVISDADVEDDNLEIDENNEKLQINDHDVSEVASEPTEVVVNNWNELQYYCSLNDNNYTLRLKENTNFYPDDPSDSSYQIVIRNNVRIIGSYGSYIGDASSDFRNITYEAITVPDKSGIGITLENITFKWIGTSYQPDGIFLCMGGDAYNYIKNCYFTEIITNMGHSSILHIKWGDAVMENCTFINCTTDFGCISIYNPLDDPTQLCTRARMSITDSYFEGNYAKTEPGCINNCGILIVRNSTFYRNSAFWWAGAIHTFGGANTTIYDSNFTDNVAGWNGGALYTYSYLQIHNTIFKGNNCTTNYGGGAIGAYNYLNSPNIYIDECLFENNENLCWSLDELSTTGTGRGGAISVVESTSFEIYNSTFIKNSASIGTAICAVVSKGSDSPNVIFKGNKFINHTRIGDVLNLRVAGNALLMADNYYYNNSIVFSKLRLMADNPVDGTVTLHIDAALENAAYYDSDILDKSEYDIYVDGKFAKKVSGRIFTLDIVDGEINTVYAVPCISNSRTNEVSIGKEKEYIYISKRGSDSNDGQTRSTPVLTIRKAIELAMEKGSIIIMDGTYDENNLTVDYDLTIIGENDATVKGKGNLFIANSSFFTVRNLTFKDASRTTQTAASNGEIMIQQINPMGFFTIENCRFMSIDYKTILSSDNMDIRNSTFTQNIGVIVKSVTLNVHDSTFAKNTLANYALLYGTKAKEWNIINTTFSENNNLMYGVVYYSSLNSVQNLNVVNSSFLSNSVKSTTTVYSSGLYLYSVANVNIKSSVFMDNTDRGRDSNLIYLYSAAKVNVKDSIFLNNRNDENNYGIIFGGYRRLQSGTVNCADNWFGNTLNNLTKPGVYDYVNMDEWLFLNIYSDDEVGVNEKTIITFEIDGVNGDGVISSYGAGSFPIIPLTLKTYNASLNTSRVDLINGRAQAEFTLTSMGDTYVTAEYRDVEAKYYIHGVKVDPDIEIHAENVVYGDDATIILTLPDDISYDRIFISVNNVSYEPADVIVIPDLTPDVYVIEVNYTGDDYKYNPKTFTSEFEVYRADPQISIYVNDSYCDEAVDVLVTVDSKVTGEIAISVGNESQRKAIEQGRALFTIVNLPANTYTVVASYEGNNYFNSSRNEANFTVKKHNSTTKISYEIIELEKRAVIDIEVSPATYGNVTIHINHNGEIEEHTFDLADSKFTYTLNNLTRGDYQVDVVYEGNEKYLDSNDSVTFEAEKITPEMTVTVNNIEYGQNAIIDVVIVGNASGNVFAWVDGKNVSGILENSKVKIAISGLTAGNNKNVTVFYEGDKNYKNASESVLFNVSKVTPTIVIDVGDVMVGSDVDVQIRFTKGVTGTVKVTCGLNTEVLNINSAMGLVRWKLVNLPADNYTITAEYAGDSNYWANETSAEFKVLDWDKAQWADVSTIKSPYESDSNGGIYWVSDVSGTIIGNMAIDHDGNIVITTTEGIYSFDGQGNIRWIFNPIGTDDNFSGIAISRDVVISPKSGDSIYFINQDDGSRFGRSNIYQASSQYAPIIDENSNVYISGEYQYSSGNYNLVVLPYSIWENGGEPILISLGKSKPTASPALIDDNLVAVACDNSLKIINVNTKSIVLSISGNTNGVKPVVGPGDIVYAVSGDSIVALDKHGNQIWKTKVSGGAGNCLAIDDERNLYSINSQGNLYSYDLISGEETKISDFIFLSGMMIGNDGRIFAGSDSFLYSLDFNGKELWKVDIGESIIGNPVMDSNGTIYLTTSNKIYALVNAPLKESGLEVTCQNITEGWDETISVSIDSEATGELTIKITSDSYSNESIVTAVNGEIIFNVSDLSPALYNVEVIYCGDERFKSDAVTAKFTVEGKKNTTILISELSVDKFASQYKAALVDSDGNFVLGVNLTLFVNGERHDAVSDVNGIATFDVALGFGRYPLKVEFAGNDDYNPSEATSAINVMDSTSIQITAIYGDLRISSVLKDSRGNAIANATVHYSLNGGDRLNVSSDDNGEFTISIVDNCLLRMEFEGNELNKGSTAEITVKNLAPKPKETIIEVPSTMTKTAVDYKAGEKGTMFYFYLKDADGKALANKPIKIGIFDKIYSVKTDTNGRGGLQINIANANYYTYAITFLGDDDYKASFSVCSLEIVKKSVTITPAKTSCTFKASAKTKTITATLKSTNSYIPKGKQVTLAIAGKTFKATIGDKGQISFNVGSVTAKGTYKVAIKYAGSNTYSAATSKTITIKIT